MSKILLKLIQENLIKNEPMLKKYISYFKKAGTGDKMSPELRTILLDDVAKDIKRKDFGHYQTIESRNPKYYHDNRSDYLFMDEINPDMVKSRINRLNDKYGKEIIEDTEDSVNNYKKFDDDDLKRFSNFYEYQGDKLLKSTDNPEDLSLLSENMNRKEDSLIDDIIKNHEELENSKIVVPHYISDQEEITNALENLLIQKQQNRMYDQYKLNQLANEQTEFPVRQYNDKEKLDYELFNDIDNIKSNNSLTDDIQEYGNYRNKFNHAVNKEEEIIKLIEDNYNTNLDDNLDDLLELKNIIRLIEDY
jgi:hypothetical protein